MRPGRNEQRRRAARTRAPKLHATPPDVHVLRNVQERRLVGERRFATAADAAGTGARSARPTDAGGAPADVAVPQRRQPFDVSRAHGHDSPQQRTALRSAAQGMS